MRGGTGTHDSAVRALPRGEVWLFGLGHLRAPRQRARPEAGWGGEAALGAPARFGGFGGVREVAVWMRFPARTGAAPKVAGEEEAPSGLS